MFQLRSQGARRVPGVLAVNLIYLLGIGSFPRCFARLGLSGTECGCPKVDTAQALVSRRSARLRSAARAVQTIQSFGQTMSRIDSLAAGRIQKRRYRVTRSWAGIETRMHRFSGYASEKEIWHQPVRPTPDVWSESRSDAYNDALCFRCGATFMAAIAPLPPRTSSAAFRRRFRSPLPCRHPAVSPEPSSTNCSRHMPSATCNRQSEGQC